MEISQLRAENGVVTECAYIKFNVMDVKDLLSDNTFHGLKKDILRYFTAKVIN